MLPRGWFRPAYRLLLMFFATTAVLVSALAWMGWRLVRQNHLLAGQRTEERRERAAETAVAALREDLSNTEAQLLRLSAVARAGLRAQSKEFAEALPKDSALLVFSSDPLQAFPAGRLLYYPDVPGASAASPDVFAAAERSEFQERDYLKAAGILQALAGHSDPAIRAETQARLGRCLRKAGRVSEALAAYERVTRAGAVSIAGLPAELVALESRLLILEGQKSDEARREAAALDSALRAGKWRITRVVYEYYRDEAARILGSNLPAPSLGVSAAAEAMLPEWQAQTRRERSAADRRILGRAAAREVAVARLQSDFVASASHEFRTPVTAMRQLSELLATGRVDGEEDRNEYYRALVRESERLHRLVEGLLTFGRMEAGALQFRFEPLDPAQLASTVVAEFEREGAAREHRIALRMDETIPPVRADRAALGCVLWNLLDNAVHRGTHTRDMKLSPDGTRFVYFRNDGPTGRKTQLFP